MREEGKRGKKIKEHLNPRLRPKSHLGQNNQASEIKQISQMRKAQTRPPGTLLSALSSRPVVTIWLNSQQRPQWWKTHYDIIMN